MLTITIWQQDEIDRLKKQLLEQEKGKACMPSVFLNFTIFFKITIFVLVP